MRSVRFVVLALLALWPLALPAPAAAQALNFPDGSFASPGAFIVGSWKWERQEPRQTVMMRFEPGGGFFFHNLTNGLQHHGSYSASGAGLHLNITRSCEDNGARCASRSPPMVVNYNLTPVSAGVFMSETERWERQAK
ncbi:MAG: hypothetical protein KF889_21315 [Alphaproteobacteria bacterium]|nr:hypothetical protein [Alphaproteobacteria bacterium]MCW5743179.1 hypothetical protein [Alphaproteobacteria bacterium]